MKTLIYALLFTCLSFSCDNAFAQLKSWSKMLIFDGAFAGVASEETGHMMGGYSFGAAFEQGSKIGQWSGGIGLMYLNSQDKNNETQREINYSSVPVTLYGKYLFGPPKFSGYFLGGFGIHFSNMSYTGEETYFTREDSGPAFTFGLGTHVFFNEKMFLDVGCNFMLLVNSYYQNGMVALLKIGLGFQYD